MRIFGLTFGKAPHTLPVPQGGHQPKPGGLPIIESNHHFMLVCARCLKDYALGKDGLCSSEPSCTCKPVALVDNIHRLGDVYGCCLEDFTLEMLQEHLSLHYEAEFILENGVIYEDTRTYDQTGRLFSGRAIYMLHGRKISIGKVNRKLQMPEDIPADLLGIFFKKVPTLHKLIDALGNDLILPNLSVAGLKAVADEMMKASNHLEWIKKVLPPDHFRIASERYTRQKQE